MQPGGRLWSQVIVVESGVATDVFAVWSQTDRQDR